jgi:hypothetical protein
VIYIYINNAALASRGINIIQSDFEWNEYIGLVARVPGYRSTGNIYRQQDAKTQD